MFKKIVLTAILILLTSSASFAQRNQGTRAYNANIYTFTLTDTTGTIAQFGNFSYIMVDSLGRGWLFNNVDSLWRRLDYDSLAVASFIGTVVSDSIDAILSQTITDEVAEQIAIILPDSLPNYYYLLEDSVIQTTIDSFGITHKDSVIAEIQAALDTLSVDTTFASFKADTLINNVSASQIDLDTLGSATFVNVQQMQNVFHSSGWV